jgi:hypothetical protein
MINSRRMRWPKHVARVGEKNCAYSVSIGNPEETGSVEGPRRRWEDAIKMDLGEIGWGGMDWIDLAQDRDQWRALVNMVMS